MRVVFELGRAYDQLACGIDVHDSSGNRVYINPAAQRMLGLETNYLQTNAPSRVPPQSPDASNHSDLVQPILALRTGVAQYGVQKITWPDGHEVWLQIEAVPTFGPEGQTSQVVTSLTDVTKLVNSGLRDEWPNFAQIFDTANQAVAVTNHAGRFEYVNPQWCEMTGYSKEDALGTTPEFLGSESETPDSRARFVGLRDGESQSFDRLSRRKDGTQFWARINASPLTDTSGRIGSLAFVSDITEIKDLMNALKESEQQAKAAAAQLDRVIETTADAILTSDLEGHCLSWNRGAERMFGWTRDEMLGVIAAAAAPERYSAAAQRRKYVVETGKDLFYESVGICKDGSRIPVLGTMSPLRNEKGEIEKILSVFKDITTHEQLKKTESQLSILEERERVGREVLDSIAQLLGYVNTKTEAIIELLRSDDIPRALGHLDELAVAARNSYGDMREAALHLRLPTPNSQPFIDSLKEYVDRWSRQCGINVSLQLPKKKTQPLLSPAGELQLLLIIQEALSNVRKHAYATHAKLGIYTLGAWVEARIEDDGAGFDTNATRSSNWPHLGLLTMEERARGVGGSLSVVSVPSQGTTVTVRLPLAQDRR